MIETELFRGTVTGGTHRLAGLSGRKGTVADEAISGS